MACHKVSYGKSITMYNHHYLPIDQGGASSEMIVCFSYTPFSNYFDISETSQCLQCGALQL